METSPTPTPPPEPTLPEGVPLIVQQTPDTPPTGTEAIFLLPPLPSGVEPQLPPTTPRVYAAQTGHNALDTQMMSAVDQPTPVVTRFTDRKLMRLEDRQERSTNRDRLVRRGAKAVGGLALTLTSLGLFNAAIGHADAKASNETAIVLESEANPNASSMRLKQQDGEQQRENGITEAAAGVTALGTVVVGRKVRHRLQVSRARKILKRRAKVNRHIAQR